MGEPVNFFRLTGRLKLRQGAKKPSTETESSGRGEFELPTQFALTPLTGRDTEFSLLKDRWEQAQEGMGQVVLVIGEPGLGKSRLVQTLTDCVQAEASDASLAAGCESIGGFVVRNSPIIEWRCSEHFQNSELHPASDYLERFLRSGRDSSPTACFERLARHLDDC